MHRADRTTGIRHGGAALRATAAFLTLVAILTAAVVPQPARAVAIGFIERFQSSGVAGFLSGSTLSNPGTGGADGAGDGYLLVATAPPLNYFLGAFNTAPRYAGNLVAAGITRMRLKLKDVGPTQAMEIHVTVGTSVNRWQYNVGFVPTPSAWTTFEADLTDSTRWTQFINLVPGTFTQAKQTHDRFHFRHDTAPYTFFADSIVADVGVDDVEMLNALSDAPPSPSTRGLALSVAPNPFNPRATIAFSLPEPANVRLEVYDAAGRKVRTLLAEQRAAGDQSMHWDGRDDAGRPAASGSYLVRLQAGQLVLQAKATLLQ
jgi:hypothetical protein